MDDTISLDQGDHAQYSVENFMCKFLETKITQFLRFKHGKVDLLRHSITFKNFPLGLCVEMLAYVNQIE